MPKIDPESGPGPERSVRMPRTVRILRATAIALVVAYAAVLLVFALLQRTLLYFPTRWSPADEPRLLAASGFESIRGRHGDVLGYRADHPGGGEATLIVAHGNAGAAIDRGYFVELARARSTRFDVILVEYPGYGARTGSPSESANVDAVVEAIDLAKRSGRPIVLLGESLGSAVVSLAADRRRHDVSALVLVTPLPRLAFVAAHHYPFIPSVLLADRCEADAAIAKFAKPVAFVVARHDEVIPARLGLAMHAAYRGPSLLVVDEDATHNTVDYEPDAPQWTRVFEFVEAAL